MADPGAICPECDGDTVDCYDENEGSDYLDKKMVCEDCETTWTAHYHVEFIENQWIDGGASS